MNYKEFLNTKDFVIPNMGFVPSALDSKLKPFQQFAVKIALQKGRFALFEDCGLGKTFQALEWSAQVARHTGNPVLNLAPFAVVEQTISEGNKFGIEVSENYCGNIHITNYEQLDQLDTSMYSGVVVDESSILKNFEGAYRNLIIDKFRPTPFKLACSATPSPNDPMELGNHAEFFGVMTRHEMLATYFVHDGGDTSQWRLKGHAVDDFWRWINTWSIMFSKPSDIGFDDEGYVLPSLRFIEMQIKTPQRTGKLFNDVAISATNFHQEVRMTKLDRLSQVVSLVNNSNESFIIWVEQDEEGDYLEKNIQGALQVKGSQKPEIKKSRLLGFANNMFRVLITKPKIAAFGLNYQNCHNQVFASPDYSYEKLYQAIRRSLRYGQLHAVNAFMVTTDTMQNVISALKMKEMQHEEMKRQMIKYTKELYGQFHYGRTA